MIIFDIPSPVQIALQSLVVLHPLFVHFLPFSTCHSFTEVKAEVEDCNCCKLPVC